MLASTARHPPTSFLCPLMMCYCCRVEDVLPELRSELSQLLQTAADGDISNSGKGGVRESIIVTSLKSVKKDRPQIEALFLSSGVFGEVAVIAIATQSSKCNGH